MSPDMAPWGKGSPLFETPCLKGLMKASTGATVAWGGGWGSEPLGHQSAGGRTSEKSALSRVHAHYLGQYLRIRLLADIYFWPPNRHSQYICLRGVLRVIGGREQSACLTEVEPGSAFLFSSDCKPGSFSMFSAMTFAFKKKKHVY